MNSPRARSPTTIGTRSRATSTTCRWPRSHALAEAVARAENVHRRRKPAPALSVRAAECGAVGGADAGRGRTGRRTRASSWKSRSAPISRARSQLNAKLHEVFAEEQIFRIDHFLGKEPAQNILAFRFANGLFEPIWNRNFIDHVQIDVPETLSLGKRTAFYESTGAYRDMVVTHLFQILGFIAMEPPTHLAPQAHQRREEQGIPQHAAHPADRRGARAVHRLSQ